MFSRLLRPKLAKSSPFSEFIRTASAAEKKRVYTVVLKKATERQKQVEVKALGNRWAVGRAGRDKTGSGSRIP
jgi:hypothetical protein